MILIELTVFLKRVFILVFILFGFWSNGNAFKQELWLYDADGTAIYFDSAISSLYNFKYFLPKVNRACAYGRWNAFDQVNFQGARTALGSLSSANLACKDGINATNFHSIRHWATNDTSIDSISLYNGIDYNKEEILVMNQAHVGITNQILSIATTGTSSWMLFEEKDLDLNGKSFCYPGPSNYYFNFDHVKALGLATIGSVFKGCDLEEIRTYKRKYSL